MCARKPPSDVDSWTEDCLPTSESADPEPLPANWRWTEPTTLGPPPLPPKTRESIKNLRIKYWKKGKRVLKYQVLPKMYSSTKIKYFGFSYLYTYVLSTIFQKRNWDNTPF